MLSNGFWGQALVADWKIFFTTCPILSHKKRDKVLHFIQGKPNEAALMTLAPLETTKEEKIQDH